MIDKMHPLKRQYLQTMFNQAFGGTFFCYSYIQSASNTYAKCDPHVWIRSLRNMDFNQMSPEIRSELLKRVGNHFLVVLDDEYQIVEDLTSAQGLGTWKDEDTETKEYTVDTWNHFLGGLCVGIVFAMLFIWFIAILF